MLPIGWFKEAHYPEVNGKCQPLHIIYFTLFGVTLQKFEIIWQTVLPGRCLSFQIALMVQVEDILNFLK